MLEITKLKVIGSLYTDTNSRSLTGENNHMNYLWDIANVEELENLEISHVEHLLKDLMYVAIT